MSQQKDDFLAGEDLDDLYFLLDGGHLDDDDGFNVEINAAVSEVADAEVFQTFKCNQCEKVCKSKRGLTRHINTKHKKTTLDNEASDLDSLQKLPFSKLSIIVENCAAIVAGDMCLPEATRKVFENFNFSLEETNMLWEKMKPLIDGFNGNAENFYAEFYGLLTENILSFKFEDIIFTNILMTEVANHVIIHLTKKNTDTVDSNKVFTSISDREMKCLQYISGYIVHKFHSKFRFSKQCASNFNRQCVAILQACKIDTDDSQTLVNARDRGGLWKVNKRMQGIFLKSECIFRSETSKFTVKIVCTDIVNHMLQNCTIISNYKSLCYDIDPKVNGEVSLNLLEQMLTLFIRLRTFSFAKDVREKHKAAKKSTKKRALRTEIKKGSSSTDNGH